MRDQLTLAATILRAAARRPQHVALRCEDQELRYGELAENILRVAAATPSLALPEAANVTLLAPNCLEYVELVAGLSGAGQADGLADRG